MSDSEDEKVLLSIVIPTKNRQFTCLYAIETALSINSADFEIVVQDCSNTDILIQQIESKFGKDDKIKYFHSADNPDMTTNWNRAIENSKGEYICAIGDDDIVLSEVYEITEWAKKKDLDAVQHDNPYTYFWPDFPDPLVKGKLFIFNSYNGKYAITKDLEPVIKNKLKNLDGGFMDGTLPMFYHSIISSKLLKIIKEKTGNYLDGTSLDVYSAFTFGLLCKSFCAINYPFTIRGACGNSNTSRFAKKTIHKHFDEFKENRESSKIPYLYNLKSTIAESIYSACVNLKRYDIIDKINYTELFAQYIVDRPLKYFTLKRKYIGALGSNASVKRLNEYVYLIWIDEIGKEVKRKIRILLFYIPIVKKLLNRNSIEAKNPLKVVHAHKMYLKNNGINLCLSISKDKIGYI